MLDMTTPEHSQPGDIHEDIRAECLDTVPSRSRVSPASEMTTLTSGNVRVQSTLDPQRADECVELINALKFAYQSLIATVLNEDSQMTFPLKLAFGPAACCTASS